MTSITRLRSIGVDETLEASFVFEAVLEAGSALLREDRESRDALEIAIRLLEAERLGCVPEGCIDVVHMLAEQCGLYPYIDVASLNPLSHSLIEAHAVSISDKTYLHSKQMQVLLWLLAGDNVILSAPTSFGKSLLVDAYIAKIRPHTVVMILPTIALIDECRRRITRNFGSHYNVITNSSDEYNSSEPTVFVLTQERFLSRKDVHSISFLFIDEFYKLDPGRDDGRYENLNLALYRALPKSKQVFMAGPHIKAIELGADWRGYFKFVQTDYRTVTVNVVDRSNREERLSVFLSDLRAVGGESSLVFTSAPPAAQTLMQSIITAGLGYETELGSQISSWISQNYHRAWSVAKGAEHGLAVHHGRLPRALGQLFVQLFDKGELKVLICTSTLIEGVNTAAANVFIYDKKINRTDLDFFSFANIRGRVGRMMRHFVGNAYLYHEAPGEVETKVDVPILSKPGDISDYLVMNLTPESLTDRGRDRQAALLRLTGLPEVILKDHGGMGVDLLMQLAEKVGEFLSQHPNLLVFSGYPERPSRIALAELCLMVAHSRRDRTGVHTPKQLAWAWAQLGLIKTTPKFLNWFTRTFGQGDDERGIDAAFEFLQACEYSFPRTIVAVEALVKHQEPGSYVDYSAYVSSMEHWFRPKWMKELDEAGIPMPLAERLEPYVGSGVDGRREAAARIKSLDLNELEALDSVDRFILQQAVI